MPTWTRVSIRLKDAGRHGRWKKKKKKKRKEAVLCRMGSRWEKMRVGGAAAHAPPLQFWPMVDREPRTPSPRP